MSTLFLFIAIGAAFFLNTALAQENFQTEIIKARIENITEKTCEQNADPNITEYCRILEVRALNGTVKDKTFTVDITDETGTVEQISTNNYKKGQVYFAEYIQKIDGSDFIQLQNIYRLPELYLLIGIFFFFIVLFGRKQGVYAVIAMALSLIILIFIVAKGIFHGYNIYLITFASAFMIMVVTLYLTYGFRKKTHAAMLGSLSALFLTCLFGYFAIDVLQLTGFGSEESSFLQLQGFNLNMVDILFAGIVIGTLGVLDDITIGQSSAAFQIAETDPRLSSKEVYKKAIIVGKDHVASMVNTLIIAYAGAFFPLFLLFVQETGTPVTYILNNEMIIEEIARMLVGSTGIILAVPLTTFIACKMATQKK